MKKTKLLLVLAFMLCVLLSGCACKHKETQVIDAYEPTCITEGYTGDTQCVSCKEVLAAGEAIPALGHTESGLLNAADSSCIFEGYSGDIECIVCGELLVQGEATPKLAHSESEPIGAIEASCTQEGYSGDIECTVCGELLVQGEVVPLAEHSLSERMLVSEPTCSQKGFTGDIFCLACGQMVESGENIEMLPHTPGETVMTTEPTCTQDGYTGDEVCVDCGAILVPGEIIPAIGHAFGEPENVIASTCVSEGYSGDRTCTVCGYVEHGEPTARLPHDYINYECSVCEWMVPGIYIQGELAMTWEDLVKAEYIAVEGTEAIVMNRGLNGLLVVEEGITSIYGRRWDETVLIEGLYLPASYTFLEDGALTSFKELKTFRSFGLVEIDHSSNDVYNSVFPESIQQVVLNEGLEIIGAGAFLGATQLSECKIPSTVKFIGSGAFRNCHALQDLVIPEGVEIIRNEAFCGIGTKELVIPASVKELGNFSENYARSRAIESVDLSRVAITELPFQAFYYCQTLKEVKLPATLTLIKQGAFHECVLLEYLDIPEGAKFEYVPHDMLPSVKYIVWPTSVTELGFEMPALETIYYRGSEMQWSFVAGKERYAGVEVIFNYTGE